MSNHYRDLILTNHAIARQSLRSINFEALYQTIHQPDKKIRIEGEKWKFIKKINDRQHQIIANYLVDQKKWLIISAWVRGEEDQVPLIWQLISAPFRLIWWTIKTINQTIVSSKTKK
jgi:hypothetical protein